MDASRKLTHPRSWANMEVIFWRALFKQRKDAIKKKMFLETQIAWVVESSLECEAFDTHQQAQRLKVTKARWPHTTLQGPPQRTSVALGCDSVLPIARLLIRCVILHPWFRLPVREHSALRMATPHLSSVTSRSPHLHPVPRGCVPLLPTSYSS